MMKTWTGQGWRDFQDGDLRPDDRGFLLGDGVFETLRVKGGTLRRGDLHRVRFEAACRAMDLDCPARWEAIAEGAETAGEDAMVRVTLSRGAGPRGLGVIEAPRPGLFLSASPVSEPPDGLALVTAPLRRSPSSLASRHKTLSYTDNAAARRAAVRAG
ncbi:MAG TPA: 2-keto-4-methylthiobutyrate aminotransferase, partial [Alphaproteobacteria bacterium]|nr:2-keto-4-methylthiobutyrate aminotransferase [Alphaproteobacteria bacterium]